MADDQTISPETHDAMPLAAPPRFVGGKVRSETVELDYPVEYDGKTWTHITVRRMTTQEVSEVMQNAGTDKVSDFPMFDAPTAVMNALDADDDERVQEVAMRFLPRRFKAPQTD
jgi:hypothetical protein